MNKKFLLLFLCIRFGRTTECTGNCRRVFSREVLTLVNVTSGKRDVTFFSPMIRDKDYDVTFLVHSLSTVESEKMSIHPLSYTITPPYVFFFSNGSLKYTLVGRGSVNNSWINLFQDIVHKMVLLTHHGGSLNTKSGNN